MTTQEIKKTIESAVAQSTAYVTDPHNDGEHFEAIVVSPVFEGIPLVKQHQLVMAALKDAFAQSVHALRLKTFTQKKWEEVREQYKI